MKFNKTRTWLNFPKVYIPKKSYELLERSSKIWLAIARLCVDFLELLCYIVVSIIIKSVIFSSLFASEKAKTSVHIME